VGSKTKGEMVVWREGMVGQVEAKYASPQEVWQVVPQQDPFFALYDIRPHVTCLKKENPRAILLYMADNRG